MFTHINTIVGAEIKKLRLEEAPNDINELILPVESEVVNNKYNIFYNKNINDGNNCSVFLTNNITTNEDVAVKLIAKDSTYSSDEVKYLSIIKHKYIIEVYDIYQDDYYYYIFMEYTINGDLFNYCNNNWLSEMQIRRIIGQVAEVLEYLHSNNIVHRDIKAENVLLTSTLDVRLTDFEYAGIISPTGELLTSKLCGTWGYIAPEACDTSKSKFQFTPKCDIWSLGAMLYSILFKRLLVDARDLRKYSRRVNRFNPDFIWSMQYSPDMIYLLKRMLDKNPSTRISINEIVSQTF